MTARTQPLPTLQTVLGACVALTALLGSLACNVHEPVAAFRATVFIGDRGISVPLPPPSLTAEPQQDVEVEGRLDDPDEIAAGTVVHLVELNSDVETVVELDAGASLFVASLALDLSNSCLEVWLEAPDGRASTPSQFSTRINIDDAVVVVSGCDETE